MEQTPNNMRTKQEKEQLFKALWDVADVLRGAMTADNFRDYMLSLLFYRDISARYEKAARKELGRALPEDKSLLDWYNDNEADVAEFEEMMRQGVHYSIKPQYLWSAIYELARTQNAELLTELENSFKHIENDSFKGAFRGLFSEINLKSDKLGKDYSARNTMMCKIISTLEDKLTDLDHKGDVLGDAYEYLIGKFAAGGGKKAGEFYTPQEVSTILSRIVTLDCQDPATGTKRELRSVLDLTCGSGSLLLNVNNQMRLNGGKIGKIYGQEKDITTFNLARMNMLLHGVHDSEFEIFHGDTLVNDWNMLRESNVVHPVTFDAVVSNPPFSLKWEPDEDMSNDPRFKNFGVAPKSAADFAFLLHGLHYLSDSGTMAIILPHGVLFRGGAEATIREKLIKSDYIDCVIGLPSNLFYSTGIPVCIIVLKKCRKNDDILFINAAELYKPEKRQNTLEPEHINKIIDIYRTRAEEDRLSCRVKPSKIKEEGYNLNITRYVSLAKEEEQIDLKANHELLEQIENKIMTSKINLNDFLRELGLDELPVAKPKKL